MKKKKESSFTLWISNHKFLWALGVFAIWMLFFDSHNVFTQINLRNTADQLIEEKEMYIREIEIAKKDIKWVESNSEKFARENYYLSMPQEDVFIFVEE